MEWRVSDSLSAGGLRPFYIERFGLRLKYTIERLPQHPAEITSSHTMLYPLA
jgi:hypothetical protein